MNKKFTEVFNFIKHQTNVDISIVASESSKPRTHVNLRLDRLSKNEKRAIEHLAYSSKRFSLSENGGLGWALEVGKS